jgi:nucleoid DNA-binding protein
MAAAKRKTAAKKAPAKKTAAAKKPAAKKAPAKKTAAAKKPAAKAAPKKATGPVKEKMTKSGILDEIATNTGLSRKQVSDVMNELEGVIGRHVAKRSVGEFALPGLLKIKTVKKPAQKARKGVPNPFKPGETMDVAAKPASTRVRITPLKKLKEMAQ